MRVASGSEIVPPSRSRHAVAPRALVKRKNVNKPRQVTGARSAQPRRRRAPAVATIGSLAVVAGYAFVSGTIVLPETPAQAAVEEVFSPYFSQSWKLFAPNIARTNRALELQAQWRDEDGELQLSDWVEASDVEFEGMRNAGIPSRVTGVTVSAAADYLGRYDELTEAQQVRVTDTFIQRDGEGGFEPIPDDELVDEVDQLGDDRTAVVRFIRYDYMLQRFADAFTEAYFGQEVERVRWRVMVDQPNSFEERFEPKVIPVSYVTFGWRQYWSDANDQIASVYDDVVGRYRS